MFRSLYKVAISTGHAHRVEDVIRAAAAEVSRDLGIEIAGLYLRDPTTGFLTVDPYTELSPIFAAGLPSVKSGDVPVFDRAISSRKVVAWPVEAIENPVIGANIEAQGFKSIAVVPLLSKAEILGVAILGRRTDARLTTEELELLEGIGNIIGVAIENAKLIEELTEQQEQLRALTAGIQQTREVEARRIARNLHDIAGHLLTAVHLRLEEVAEMLPPPAQEHLQVARDQLCQAEEQLRQLSHELRSPILDDLGLEPALNFLTQGFAARADLKITVEGTIGERLPPEVETVLYRSIQEALSNVAKHARATRVWITLQRVPEEMHCTVKDDGIGFDPRAFSPRPVAGGIGLLSIRERLAELGGTLEITSAPRQGTELHMRVPLP